MHQRPSAPSPLQSASATIVLCRLADDGYTNSVVRSNDREGATNGEALLPRTNDLCLFLCLHNHTIKQSSFFCSKSNHLCDKPFARFVRFELCPMLWSLFISEIHAFIQTSIRKCKSSLRPALETALHFLLDLCGPNHSGGLWVCVKRQSQCSYNRDRRINMHSVLG